MKFNNKELAHLALNPSTKFDKEGVLFMKDKQDGLFKKGEVFFERYLKLKGNMLFYFKNKEVLGDPIGVLILERCTIELSAELEGDQFGFIIVYEGDDHTYQFRTDSEDERDSWIQCLHISSYECLKMQLQSLREQIQARTGRDPISQTVQADTDLEFEIQSGNVDVDPAVEISITCDELLSDSSGTPPNPLAVVYTMIPPQQNWIQNNHTEVVEKNNSPQFLKTIGFGDSSGVDTCTRVKITIFHVKERVTGIMSQLGHVIFTLQDVLVAPQMILKLDVQGPDPLGHGVLTVMAWINDSQLTVCKETQKEGAQYRNSMSREQKISVKRCSRKSDTLRKLFTGIISRSFRFDTTNGKSKLLVSEYLGESKTCFDIPCQLLKLWIDEEKNNISQLQELGQLDEKWVMMRTQLVELMTWTGSLYETCLASYLSYKGQCFKSSSKKGEKEYEFVPVNLHIQRMTVASEMKNANDFYDTFTVGAFTAYPQKYKIGGLRRMLAQQKDSLSADATLSKVTKLQRCCELLNAITSLKDDIFTHCDQLCHVATSGSAEELHSVMQMLADKVKELVSTCDNSLVQQTANQYSESKVDASPLPVPVPSPGLQHNSPSPVQSEQEPSGKSWKWTGSNFIHSPTSEPWEMTRVNAEAALVCLVSLVDDLIQNKSGSLDRPKWLESIGPAVTKLKGFVDLVISRVTQFMTFLFVMENKGCAKLMHMIKYRRDVCFSQGLTSIVCAIANHIESCEGDTHYIQQIAKIGILLQVEALLSCYGDEMGMLEDMVVAMEDLSQVTVKFEQQQDSDSDSSPSLSLTNLLRAGIFADFNRHCILIKLPIQEKLFKKFPVDLQKGQPVKINIAFFNVGINEQASLAEKFGDTSLQDHINHEGLKVMGAYKNAFQTLIGDMEKSTGSLSDLFSKLSYNVSSKKSKNTEILRLSAELTRRMKGIRFTSCKSGKDRTAMSVTLEQVKLLQQEHDLASHVFSQALDCFRSEGVRRENLYKNIGVRKYAFNALQLMYVPKQYRPPSGTYGNVMT